MIKLIAATILLALATPVLAELTFYSLSHKAPEDIIPTVRPFLQPGETIGAGYNELILRIEPENIADIRKLIKKLDKPAHRLIIHVNRDGQFNRQTEGYNVNNRINIGVGSGLNSSYKGRVKIYSTTDNSSNKNNQTIQVLEGHTAHISEGVSEPINNIQIQQYGSHNHISSTTNYREASNGFYVTPRLANGSVILEIAPWYEEPLSKNRTSAEFTRASSVIRGRLNTWIQLAGIDDSSTQAASKIFGQQTKTVKRKNTIWVKVVDLDSEPLSQ